MAASNITTRNAPRQISFSNNNFNINYGSATRPTWAPRFLIKKTKEGFTGIATEGMKAPKYDFGEAMALSRYGYTGIYGRTPNKQTLGLIGENWKQYYALERFRANQSVPLFSIAENTPEKVLNDIAAATPLVYGSKKYNQYLGLYSSYNDKYGITGYQDRYGHTPTLGSKYGILFNTNNRAIRQEDVKATEQNNLAMQLVQTGKSLIQQGKSYKAAGNPAGDALIALGQTYLPYGEYKLSSNRSKPNQEKIAEMQGLVAELQRKDPRLEQFLKDNTPVSEDQQNILGIAAGTLAGLAGQPQLAAAAFNYFSSDSGSKNAQQALDYMNGLAESDVLKSTPIYWGKSMQNQPIGQRGIIGLSGNAIRGLARMSLGAPTGLVMATDDVYMASKESAKWATNDNYDWGNTVDFKMGDMIWKDFAQRYYDPFAYNTKGVNRGFWNGFSDSKSWDALGEKMGADPVAYGLDIASVAPVIGWGAKAAAFGSTSARLGRVFGTVGIKAADIEALNAARARLTALEGETGVDTVSAAEIDAIRKELGIVGKDYEHPFWEVTTADEATKLDALVQAFDEVGQMQAKIAEAPSARAFRRTVRAAINGDSLALQALDRWRALGLEFNGADKSWSVRASAVFEPRTKVLDKPESVINASSDAIIRLPASPFARAAKEGFFWVGRGFDRAAIAAAGNKGITGRIGAKMLDMPALSYRWNYTKAIRDENMYAWGDTASELQRAATMLKIDSAADLPSPMRRAIEAHVMGGEGEFPLQYPAIQRQQIQDKIRDLPRDKKTGKVLGIAKDDLILLQDQLKTLLDDTIAKVEDAAASYDSMFDSHLGDLRARLADPLFKADDVMLDAAVDLVKRLERQDMVVRTRILHDDTTPKTFEHLKMLYSEAIDGLRLSKLRLFGKKGNAGRVGRWVGKVVRPNSALLTLMKFNTLERGELLALAQKAEEAGTIWDDIADPVLKAQRQDDMIAAVDALQQRGLFIDGLGSFGTSGRPIMVLSDLNVGKDFVAFHLPRLRHTMENGKIINGKIIDTTETFILPKVFFAARKKGKGSVILETAKDGRDLFYQGAFNAMSDIYPKARFYSEKLNDTGLNGVRANEQMIATEHTVAESGMRQHALSRIIQSQVNYLRSRVERDLRGLAESQAVVLPASEVVGKTARQSGYRVFANVGVFDNIGDALDFAALRGVKKEAEAAFKGYTSGTLPAAKSWLDVTEGMGYMLIDGQPKFIVRGGHRDWLLEATMEDISKHTTTSAWQAREFANIDEIPRNGYVLAIPNKTYRALSEMTIESDTLAQRILTSSAIKGWGNVFKWFVLNANPGFVANNVIGGLAMMMMYNPSAAPRIMATAIQKMARESLVKGINNDWFTAQLAHFKGDSEAVSRQLAYELEHNIYKQDSGIQGVAEGVPWWKKNVFYGGYTLISTWEEMMRRNVAMQFLHNDPGFRAFMNGPEVKKYIEDGVDWHGNTRTGEDAITPFEAATDLLLDRGSPYFNAALKHRMRYMTNTVSGNYHSFNPTEQLMRNVLMPFYSWMRHSATFTYRMFVDKPITTNFVYNFGQQGYLQNAQQGYPDWMMSTIPAPMVIKDMFGITDPDFRLDGQMLSPFGATADLGRAAFQILTGTDMGKNVFEFGNPYVNELIQSTLGVDPRTGRIDWQRLKDTGMQPQGLADMGKDMFFNVFKATYPYKIAELMKYKEYEQDALANKYSAIDNAPDIIKNYDPSQPNDPWRLSIPKMRLNEAQDPTQRLFSAFGIKSYRFNPNSLPIEARRDAVGAIVMKYISDTQNGSKAQKALSSAQEWKRRYDYVMQVWLPVARAQGMSEAQIMFVLNKIKDEKPKTGVAKQLANGMGG